MSDKTIVIASDHGGFQLKAELKKYMSEAGYDVVDLGCDGPESVDYPDYANALVAAIKQGRAGRGVLLCGSGIGVSMAANRHHEIRAALIHDAFGARVCRLHNNANVICMGERMTGFGVALDCLKIFLETEFEGGRHCCRVDKLSDKGA